MRRHLDQFLLEPKKRRYRKRNRAVSLCAKCPRVSGEMYLCKFHRRKQQKAQRRYAKRRRAQINRHRCRRLLLYHWLIELGYGATEARRYSTSARRAVSAPRPAVSVSGNARALYRLMRNIEVAASATPSMSSLKPRSETELPVDNSLLRAMFTRDP